MEQGLGPAYRSDFRAVVSNAIWLERLRLALSSKRGACLGGLFRACKNGMKPVKLEPWRNRPSKKYRKRRNKTFPRMVPWIVSYAPKTQKALNNQGFEYGGSVEIRTQRNGFGRAGGLDFHGMKSALTRDFVPKVFPEWVGTSPRLDLPSTGNAVSVDPSKNGNFGN